MSVDLARTLSDLAVSLELAQDQAIELVGLARDSRDGKLMKMIETLESRVTSAGMSLAVIAEYRLKQLGNTEEPNGQRSDSQS